MSVSRKTRRVGNHEKYMNIYAYIDISIYHTQTGFPTGIPAHITGKGLQGIIISPWPGVGYTPPPPCVDHHTSLLYA